MAIGVRIESNNLSGKTTDVTFLPTSGGTIDLGSQTIPFNVLTADPYGVYQIYVPDYNYTYELSVNASVFSGQSFSFVSRLTTNYDNGSITLNYNDFTAEIIDLGVDYSGWYITDLYPLTNSGYAYYFEQDNNSCWKWVIFTDVFGNIIDQYQAFTDCEDDWDDLGGKWLTFVDNYNGVLKYFNGENVYTYNFDSGLYSLNVDTGYDGVMSNNNFVVSLYEYNTSLRTYYIVNSSGLTQFGTPFNTNSLYDDFFFYFSGNFFGRLIFDNNSSSIISLEFYDGNDGTLLDNVVFPNSTYYNYDVNYYGNNKMYVIIPGNNGNSQIIHFDGNTSTMKTFSYNENTYVNYDNDSRSNFSPNNGGSESFAIQLYTYNTTNELGREVTQAKIVYMLSGDTDFRTYDFQNSGLPDKTLSYYINTCDNAIYAPCNNGDGFVSTLCLSQTGATYINSNVTAPSPFDIYQVGNNSVTVIYSDNSITGCTLNYISDTGVLLDSITGITFGSQYQYRIDSVGNVFRFTNYGDTNVFINTTSTQFQDTYSMNNQDYGHTPNTQFKPDFIRTGTLLIVNDSTKYSSIIKSNAFITGSTLPQSSGSYNLEVGEDKFMYVYFDSDNFVNIELYDFDFNLLNSEVTTYTNWWGTNSCGNRFYTIINDNSQYIVYLVSESNITSKTLTDDNSYDAFNDYINWD